MLADGIRRQANVAAAVSRAAATNFSQIDLNLSSPWRERGRTFDSRMCDVALHSKFRRHAPSVAHGGSNEPTETTMNKILIIAALGALVSSPALAKSTHVRGAHASYGYATQNYETRHYVGPNRGWTASPYVRGAQARYYDSYGYIPYGGPTDLQLGNDYEQRP
jgi:hypothetical protein